jgi:hypothetical protein
MEVRGVGRQPVEVPLSNHSVSHLVGETAHWMEHAQAVFGRRQVRLETGGDLVLSGTFHGELI